MEDVLRTFSDRCLAFLLSLWGFDTVDVNEGLQDGVYLL